MLEDRCIERLGSNKSIQLDIRVIAATKVDLSELCEHGEFRQDLLYRLNLVTVPIPALRDRREDIRCYFCILPVLLQLVTTKRISPSHQSRWRF